MFCPNCGKEIDDKAVICIGCGTSTVQKKEPELPMNWYKFLINFALWAGAVVNFYNAIKVFVNIVRAVIALGGDISHLLVPFIIDALQAVGVIALGVLAIVTRFKLAKFKKDGPLLLYMLYGGNCVFTVIFNAAVFIVGSVPMGVGYVVSLVISLLVYVNLVLLNRQYFNKRKHLFVN